MPRGVGDRISRYRIVAPLGRGGMGEVVLAFDALLSRHVAIKYLRTDKTDPATLQRLGNEARHLAKLNHPNIIHIYDILTEHEQTAIVMEYVKGQTLAQVLQQRSYSRQQALDWLIDIGEGLATAHHHGILHRDLKAENILVSEQSLVKIADFGIAKNLFDPHSTEHLFLGSFASVSPEQLTDTALDFPSDIFSFGVLAVLLCCGQHPFGDPAQPAQLLANLARHQLQFPLDRDVASPALAQLLSHMLQPLPHQRPQHMAEVVATLKTLQRQEDALLIPPLHGHPAPHTTRVAASPPLPATPSKRLRHPLSTQWAGLSLALLAIALLFGLVWRWPQATPYVAVVHLSHSEEAGTPPGAADDTVRSTLQGLKDALSMRPDIALLSVPDSEQDPAQIQRYGADSILVLHSDCQSTRCDLQLERLRNGEVLQRRQWASLHGWLADTHSAAAEQVRSLFPAEHSRSNASPLEEQDHALYLSIAENLHTRARSSPADIANAADLIRRYPHYAPLYTLYRELIVYAYGDTSDTGLLDSLAAVLRGADKHLEIIALNQLNWYELRLAQGRLEEAAEHARAYEQWSSDYGKRAEMRAQLALAEGKTSAAIQHFQKALRFRTTRKSLYGLAEAYWRSQTLPEAKQTLARLLEFHPGDYFGLQLLAKIYLHEGDLTAAVPIYETLITRNPESSNYANAAFVHLLNGDAAAAIPLLEQALQLSPLNSMIRLNLADAYDIDGQHQRAKAQYREVIRLTQSSPQKTSQEVLIALSQAHAQLGEALQAVTNLQTLIRHTPDDPNTLFTAALVYTLVGDTVSAVLYTDKALSAGVDAIWFRLPFFNRLCENDLEHSDFRHQTILCDGRHAGL